MTIVSGSECSRRLSPRAANFCTMGKATVLVILLVLSNALGDDASPTPSAAETLGNLYRQARSEMYYGSRYATEGSSVTSGAIGIRGEPEHRDAAYYESRCITCDPNKSAGSDRGWRQRNRYDYYDDDYFGDKRDRDRYDNSLPEMARGSYDYDRMRPAYDYDRMRGGYDYDRPRGPPFDYDRIKPQSQDYDRYDPYLRRDMTRPMSYPDRYDVQTGRDRYYDSGKYDHNVDRYPERGNGYDNLDQRHLYAARYDPYSSRRRPMDDSYINRYDRYNRNYPSRYDPYERYDPYWERSYNRRPYDDRYERYPIRDRPDSRGYFSSGVWGPGYERGYASSWNYLGPRDSWRETGRDREPGSYRPRDYFHDSTASPGGSRGTSYIYDRPESSTKPDSTERDKPTSSPQTQDNKVYKD
ncbi:putative DNA helicase INO80 isoform X2 [Fopius arisanus]|uniref:DNA helicase INO80 isoform X2 n=1 Tax=Fopius arisanus TaxID=64838 RepID=A0A0C9QBL2_9HYME|nr:PREDICTED: putative DNA helicase INO80 isoform X2 [Fopius arisanus]